MGGGQTLTFCHMTDIPGCGGGGWTLAMKIDGSKVGIYDITGDAPVLLMVEHGNSKVLWIAYWTRLALCQYTWPQYAHRGENHLNQNRSRKFAMVPRIRRVRGSCAIRECYSRIHASRLLDDGISDHYSPPLRTTRPTGVTKLPTTWPGAPRGWTIKKPSCCPTGLCRSPNSAWAWKWGRTRSLSWCDNKPCHCTHSLLMGSTGPRHSGGTSGNPWSRARPCRGNATRKVLTVNLPVPCIIGSGSV